MATAHDIAAYILEKAPPVMTVMKLQKLVYYAQAWSLVWDEAPLFEERIEAWANGPVVPELYAVHKGMFRISEWPQPNADSAVLTEDEQGTVDAVVKFYGRRSAQWLSDLTHGEEPWRKARKGLSPRARGSREITHASMAEYYGSL